MEMILVLLAFIAGGTIILLLIDGASYVAARALVSGFNRFRHRVRPPVGVKVEDKSVATEQQ